MTNPAKVPLRIAATIFALFALGHTLGFLSYRPDLPGAGAVLDQMRAVSFDFGGHQTSWWDLYKGFGLTVSVALVVYAVLAWRFSAADCERGLVRLVAWMLCLTQLAGLAICLAWFGPVQSVFSAVLVLCLGWAAISVSRARGG